MIKRLIFTDFRRGQKKRSYMILMGVVILLMIILAVVATIFPGKVGKADQYENFFSLVTGFIPFLVGIPVFQTVITDDFRSRSMQTAIGRGISRKNLILARFFEIIIMLVEAFIVFTIFGAIIGLIMGMSGSSVTLMVIKMWSSSLLIFAHLSLAMLLTFMTLNPTVGLVFYILFSSGIFSGIFTLLDKISFLRDNGIMLENYIPSGLGSKFVDYTYGRKAEELLGVVTPGIEQDVPKGLLYALILVVCYCVIPLILSQVVFRKKELDF